jgi:glyoxylase-like metal-dependent hydrolase (beta-lactamase superfamily II)
MKNELNGHHNNFKVAEGVYGMKDVFVNFYMIKNDRDNSWVLVDAGLKWSAGKIKKMAASLFGKNNPPKAILLTHGHFDHVGSVDALAEEWDVPVYAHYMEIPYLTGKSSYPPPDPTVGGGLMSLISPVYPNTPINIWSRVLVLPSDGTVPTLPEWKYIHTPGHAPGHISLFRENDKVLIAGDAFVTTKQESVLAVMFQTKIISGPPKYFTYDWVAAKESVRALFALDPKVAATGHGQIMQGDELRDAMLNLTQHFEKIAIPAHGRYVEEAAIADTNGIIYLPHAIPTNNNSLIITSAAVTAGLVVAMLIKKKKKKKKKRETEYLLDFEYNF